jgi:hypothetical protein
MAAALGGYDRNFQQRFGPYKFTGCGNAHRPFHPNEVSYARYVPVIFSCSFTLYLLAMRRMIR